MVSALKNSTQRPCAYGGDAGAKWRVTVSQRSFVDTNCRKSSWFRFYYFGYMEGLQGILETS